MTGTADGPGDLNDDTSPEFSQERGKRNVQYDEPCLSGAHGKKNWRKKIVFTLVKIANLFP